MGTALRPVVLFRKVTAMRSQKGVCQSFSWIRPKWAEVVGGTGQVEVPAGTRGVLDLDLGVVVALTGEDVGVKKSLVLPVPFFLVLVGLGRSSGTSESSGCSSRSSRMEGLMSSMDSGLIGLLICLDGCFRGEKCLLLVPVILRFFFSAATTASLASNGSSRVSILGFSSFLSLI